MVKETKKKKGDFISRFEILSQLGEGGMGIVYKAHDPHLDKTVGLKIIRSSAFTEEQQVRFQQEAKALKDLRHESIPEVYNFAISRDGEPYLVMEYIEGTSLKQLEKEKGKFAIVETRDLVVKICDALAYAHKNGIVHRDIKPDNIILSGSLDSAHSSDSGNKKLQVKIIDFGLAKLEHKLTENQDMTKTGQIFGSPPYMSPEQIRGQITNAPSDIYSLGCVMFELLAGEPPYVGESSVETISMHLRDSIDSCMSKLPLEIQSHAIKEVIRKTLQKGEHERYQSIEELKRDLLNLELVSNFKESKPVIDIPAEISDTKSSISPWILIGTIAAITIIPTVLFFYLSDLAIGTSKGDKKTEQSADQEAYSFFETDGWERFTKLGDDYWRTTDQIDDQGFKDLRSKTKVRVVRSEMSDNITGSGIADLQGLAVEEIVIGSMKLDNRAFTSAQKLKHLKVLYLGQVTKADINGYKVLKDFPSLVNLTLAHSEFPPGAIEAVSQCNLLRSLTLNASKPISSGDIEALCHMKKLQLLSLERTDLSGKQIRKLKQAKKLKFLSLAGTKVSDEDLNSFVELPLVYLNLSHTKISDKGLKELAKIKSVQRLIIESCPNISNVGVASFKSARPNCVVKQKIAFLDPFKINRIDRLVLD